MRRKLIIAAATVPLALIAIYGLGCALVLPRLARDAIAHWQAQTPGLQVGLGGLSFNPLTWTLKAQGLDIRHSGRPLIHVDGLEVGLSFTSLVDRAVVLREVAVHGVSVSLQWDAHGYLDIERILPHQRREPAVKKAGPTIPWQIDHLALTTVQVRVVDPAVGLADALELSLPSLDLDHIGTLHGGDDKFSLDLHGRYENKPVWDLHWQGDVDFAPLSSTGHIQLAHLSLPWLGQSVGHRLPMDLRQGQLDFNADYELGEVQGQRRLSMQRATLDVQQLNLTGKGRLAPEFLLRRLHIQTASIDMVRHQVLGEVFSLESPELTLHRGEDGQVDLTGLLQQLPKSKAPAPTAESSPAPAWAVTWPLAEVRSAAIRFDDRSPQGFGDVRLPRMDVRIENLQTTDDAPLRLAARGEGPESDRGPVTAHWSVNGSLRPRSGALHLAWTVEDLNLGQLSNLLARQARLVVQQGQLAAQGSIDGDIRHPAQLTAASSVHVRQIDVLATEGRLQCDQMDVGPVTFSGGHLRIDAIGAQTVHASQGDRVIDLDRLAAAAVALDPDGPKAQLQRLQLSGLKWDAGASSVPHLLGKQGQVTLRGLAWDGAKQRLHLHRLFFAGGGTGLQSATQNLRVGWKKLELQDLTGSLATQRLKLESLVGSDLFWHGRQPWVKLPAVSLQGVRVDLRQQQIALGTIRIDGGQVLLSRRKDGGIQLLTELQRVLAAERASGPPAQGPAAVHPAGPAWQLALQGVDIALSSIEFEDHRKQLPPLQITNLAVHTGAWSSAGHQALQEHLELSVDGGQWQWDGTLSLQPLTVDGQLAIQHVDLKPLQDALAQRSYAGIDHGSVSTSGKLNLHSQAGAYQLHYEGAVQVGDTRIVDVRNSEPVLSWSDVNVPHVTLDWPGGAQIPRVDLDGLYTRIAILPDHRINWASLLLPPARATAPAASTPDEPATLSWPVHVDQVTLKDGGADFADESLRSPFAAKIHALNGNIGPFASDAPQGWTNMQLKGLVNEGGHVDMTGRIMALSKPLSVDASLHFRDIELPTLNPYAAEFAGYRIDQGKLDLQLQYKLDQGLIQGSNRARIDQLVLGPQVRTDGVPDLPVHLIIDILSNDDGVIELDVPIQGDLNKPDLTLRDIAFTALEGALRDVVESPFRLVASLLGSDADTLRHIGFTPGAADLSPHDQTKLQNIAQVLGRHQKMVISIQPAYNPDVDTPKPQQNPAPAATAARDSTPGSDRLRALALQRAEAIREVLTKSGIHNRRIFIDEPSNLTSLGKGGTVLTTLDLKVP
jgi:outer membrane protein OmpA-like peptidoglycan-associated protein